MATIVFNPSTGVLSGGPPPVPGVPWSSLNIPVGRPPPPIVAAQQQGETTTIIVRKQQATPPPSPTVPSGPEGNVVGPGSVEGVFSSTNPIIPAILSTPMTGAEIYQMMGFPAPVVPSVQAAALPRTLPTPAAAPPPTAPPAIPPTFDAPVLSQPMSGFDLQQMLGLPFPDEWIAPPVEPPVVAPRTPENTPFTRVERQPLTTPPPPLSPGEWLNYLWSVYG